MIKKIEAYIKTCFEDAARSEQRELHPEDYSAEFILYHKDELGERNIYLIPLLRCKYQRVLTRVRYRLERNLKKNFGVIFEEYMNLYERNCFGEVADPNHAIARFEWRGKQMTLCDPMINHNCIPYHDIPMKDLGKEMDVTATGYYWKDMTFSRYKELYAMTYGSWPERRFEVSSGVKALDY